MQWLSRGAEALVERVRDNLQRQADRNFDVVVVGSGYGGAVAACRLAEAGHSVCVLERGEEYVPGEFPNDLSNLPKHLRIERADRDGVIGRRDGLFNVRLHGAITTLVGNALGGGSQINANVALRPDKRIFDQKCWPEALQKTRGPLDSHFESVEKMLNVQRYPQGRPSTKAMQLQRLEQPLAGSVPGARFSYPPLAITYSDGENSAGVAQKECTGCGDCVTGCNVGAKNTLTMNYLPTAVRAGAELYTGATVLAVDPRAEDFGAVYFTYTDYDLSRILQGLTASDLPGREGVFQLRARMVILAAGSLGSSEILLRSRELGLVGKLPCLGTRFSANGDGLHFGVDQNEEVNAVGWGADGWAYANGKCPGPSIVSMIDLRDGQRPSDGMVIEDGIIPGPLVHGTHELLTTLASLAQLDNWTLKRSTNGFDPLALSEDALRRTQVYLGIGHDEAAGTIQLKKGRAFVSWPKHAGRTCQQRQEDLLSVTRERDNLDAIFLANPSLQPLPPALRTILSGPPLEGTTIVVHPLGGCPMGEDFEHGVVDHSGAVFDCRTPRSTYRELYVWDGSILPCSLGVNPFLTIGALAERAVEQLLESGTKKSTRSSVVDLPPLPPAQPPRPRAKAVGVLLSETMRGRLTCGRGVPLPADEHGMCDAALRLNVEIDDLVGFLGSPEHRVDGITGTLHLAAASKQKQLEVARGSITLLAPEKASACGRICRTWRGGMTWLRKRGRFEIPRFLLERLHGKHDSRSAWQYIKSVLRQAYHSGERREMRYELKVLDGEVEYALRGTKTLRYAIDSGLWDSLLDLPLEIGRPGGAALAAGCLRLDLMSLTGEDFPQLRNAGDLPNALAALASLPLFFLRVILKLYLWDFRAPDYASPSRKIPRFVERARWRPSAGASAVALDPERHEIRVPGGSALPPGMTISLPLTRFAAPGPQQGGEFDAQRMPILLLHGFCQSSRAFVAEPLQQDLLGCLLERNFDVWLLDYRISTALPVSREQCSLDDVARYDIPGAVEYILRRSGRPQLMVFGHCMGAATLAMSQLAGHLGEGEHRKIKAAVLSQVPPCIVGGYYSNYRQHLVAFLRDALGLRNVNLAADASASAWEVVMDRLFATLPLMCEHAPYGERAPESCLGEHDDASEVRTDIATCRRISGIIGLVYAHHNVRLTHRIMHHYFGHGSVSVFAQIAKFFEYERLVTADGANAYLTGANIQTRFDLPTALLHGEWNQLFNIESALRSAAEINGVHAKTKPCTVLNIERYGHFDCLIGDHAHADVFPKVTAFLRRHL